MEGTPSNTRIGSGTTGPIHPDTCREFGLPLVSVGGIVSLRPSRPVSDVTSPSVHLPGPDTVPVVTGVLEGIRTVEHGPWVPDLTLLPRNDRSPIIGVTPSPCHHF